MPAGTQAVYPIFSRLNNSLSQILSRGYLMHVVLDGGIHHRPTPTAAGRGSNAPQDPVLLRHPCSLPSSKSSETHTISGDQTDKFAPLRCSNGSPRPPSRQPLLSIILEPSPSKASSPAHLLRRDWQCAEFHTCRPALRGR